MKKRMKLKLTAIIVALVCANGNAGATTTYTPRISVETLYDDNINMKASNEESSVATTLLPGIGILLSDEKTNLSADYEGGFSFYFDDSSRNFFRHAGNIIWRQQLADHLALSLSDRYTQTEDPIVTTQGQAFEIRRDRNVRISNAADAVLSYQFGEQDSLRVGGRSLYVDDKSASNDDSKGEAISLDLDKWFSVHWGLGLSSGFEQAKLDQSSDFDQYKGGVKVRYRMTPAQEFHVKYDLLRQYFTEPGNDYWVHRGAIGADFELAPDRGASLEVGHFLMNTDNESSRKGLMLQSEFHTRTEKSSFQISASGGFNQDYFSSQNLGSSQYREIAGNAAHSLAEKLQVYAAASHRWEEFFGTTIVPDRKDRTWRVSSGASLSFLQWMTLALDASHTQRASSSDDNNVEDNRISLRLTASRPFQSSTN